jgi:hypothetical protein
VDNDDVKQSSSAEVPARAASGLDEICWLERPAPPERLVFLAVSHAVQP